MRICLGCWLLLALVGVAAAAPAAPPAPVDIDPLIARGTYGTIKISPTGAYYAVTVRQAERTVLAIIRRADRKVSARVAGAKFSDIADFWWVNDERVVVSMAERFGSLERPFATGELHAVNADGKNARLLVGYTDVDRSSSGASVDFSGRYRIASLVDDLPNDDDNILVALAEADSASPWTGVERVNVNNGRRTRVTRAPVQRAQFVTDGKGALRYALGFDDDNYSRLFYRDNDQDEWRLVNDEWQSHRQDRPLGFSADGNRVYFQVTEKTGTDAIVLVDLASGKRSELQRDELVDPYAITYDYRHQPIAASYMRDRLETRFFDEQSEAAKAQRMLERAFPGSAVMGTTSTRDGALSVVGVFSDRDPGAYFLFNRETRKADYILSARDDFDAEAMAASEPIRFQARDGLSLHGYLTRPRGSDGKTPGPMVVLPHGGPFGVFDGWDFDTDSQLLARAGYTVLRVNFRGSGNYGHAFQVAGARQWGGRMQDDLSDATRWAIAAHIADPERIGIVGASYGAYAALMGAVLAPELYRCAVGYVGVYDLAKVHKDDSHYADWTRAFVEQWIGPIDRLDALSPSRLAERIKAPVFLAAGGADRTAPIEHSRMMERALKAAKVPVETLYFDQEGHGFYSDAHRRAYYVHLLDFLARHLGGARARQGAGG